MRYIYLMLLCIALGHTAWGKVFEGYIVTHSGVRLTGQISKLRQTVYECSVAFTNEFGDEYTLHPRLIRGFVYASETDTVIFESKIIDNRWTFLRRIGHGRGISLYYGPEFTTSMIYDGTTYTAEPISRNEYWLQIQGQPNVTPVYRWGFRSQMRRLVKERAPDLAKKIGKKGYRFRDLENIIEEYNELVAKRLYRM